MALIILETSIKAPIERVFDLSRSIDLHTLSTVGTNERAIAGRTSGLIEMGESVTWRARHLGVVQHLTSKITAFERPYSFSDTMQKGAFACIHHLHTFETKSSFTLMTDRFEFRSPFGWLGKIVDSLFLKNYLKKFLIVRNQHIKDFAETDQWKMILGEVNNS